MSLSRAAADQARALTRSHEVRFEGPEEPLIGWWDHDRLAQVLQNLLTNATKYSPDGGTIVVRVADDGCEVRVSVSDQGPGIAPDALPNLFRRFYRTIEAKASGARASASASTSAGTSLRRTVGRSGASRSLARAAPSPSRCRAATARRQRDHGRT